MSSFRKILIFLVVAVVGIGLWIWLQGIGRDTGTVQHEYVEFPIEISTVSGEQIQQHDWLTVVVTLHCQLSSLSAGCGADQLYASMGGGCEWQSTDLRLINHKVFSSGYEEARWDLRTWKEGPLWLTTAQYLPLSCSNEPSNARRFVGSVHVSTRESLD